MVFSNKVLTFFGVGPNTSLMRHRRDIFQGVQKQGIIEKVNNIWANHRGKIILIGALAAIIGIKFGVESYSNQKSMQKIFYKGSTSIAKAKENLEEAWSDYWDSNCDPKKELFANESERLKNDMDIWPIDPKKGLDKKYNLAECAKIKQNYKDVWIKYWDSECKYIYNKPPLIDGKRNSKCEYYRKKNEPFYETVRTIERKLFDIKLSDQEKCWAKIANMGREYLENFNNCMKKYYNI
ncbi:MAG: hypothetical protein K940chlam1_00460 [Candidatus Anoxychlamydiales bacterium]|nr:hypothetical protein [Candidatus Anoxychlamydiales bacterium]NGX35275.1 hypothetical protein [Candidatus Anoxychlamydiales bacterium]